MTRREQIDALIARVQGGETGREVDAGVALAAGWRRLHGVWWVPPAEKESGLLLMPPFSTSIDAQAALPGRIVQVHLASDGIWGAMPDGDYTIQRLGTAPTEPAARLSAHLMAMKEAQP